MMSLDSTYQGHAGFWYFYTSSKVLTAHYEGARTGAQKQGDAGMYHTASYFSPMLLRKDAEHTHESQVWGRQVQDVGAVSPCGISEKFSGAETSFHT